MTSPRINPHTMALAAGFALATWVLIGVHDLKIAVARLDERFTALIVTLKDDNDRIAALQSRVGAIERAGH